MAIKWQDILKYTSGGTISVFFLIVLLANLAGMSYSDDGDKTCSDCYSKIEINSTYWEVCVEFAGDDDLIYKKQTRSRRLWINLDKVDLISTNPKANTELLVPTISKYATIKHPEYGYLRPVKDGDCIIKRKTLARPYPSRLIIHGINIKETVKWGFELDYWLSEKIDIDPIWWVDGTSYNITKICDYETFHTNKTIPIYETFTYDYTCPTDYYDVQYGIGYCYERRWWPANQTETFSTIKAQRYDRIVLPKTIEWDTRNKTGEYIEIINSSICHLQGYQVNKYAINFISCGLYACGMKGDWFYCTYNQDRDSYVAYNPITDRWIKKIDSKDYVKLRDCVVKV